MDIINPKFLSSAFNYSKRKIYYNFNQSDSKESSPEKTKRKKKRKEEDFLQLFPDSNSLEEISPSLAKKIKSEEIKELSKMDQIIKIENKLRNNKKRRSSKKRNNSSININFALINKNFKEEKEETQHESESLNEKDNYSRKKTVLYQSYPILEEEQNEEEDNNGNIINEVNSNISNWNSSNKSSYISLSKYYLQNHGNIYNRNHISKSQENKAHGKRRSKLLDSIHKLSKIIDVYLFKSKDPIKIEIRPTDTVKEIKTKIISKLKEQKYNIQNTSIDAYDLRVLDEPNESPDLDIPPLRDYVKVLGLMPQALIFLENTEFEENSINTSSNNSNINISREKSFDSSSMHKNAKNFFLSSFQMKMSKGSIVFEDEDKNSPKKFEVKVYYKDIKDENNINCESIFLNEKDTLVDILRYFFKKNLLVIKNINLYFFITHNSEEDFENGYNLDIEINSLTPPYELDLCYKYFPDLPQALNPYQLSVNKNKVEEKIKELSI